MPSYVVRHGLLGHVGRFRCAAEHDSRLPRGQRIVCETSRGLEVGEVLLCVDDADDSDSPVLAGTIQRAVSVADDLLIARQFRYQQEAYAECVQLLAERGVAAVLVDVEHLFDGQSLYFYFLGTPPDEAEELTAALTERYEATVRFRPFTDAVIQGCGPACGTESAAGCGSGGCSSCQLSSVCGKSHA